MSFASASNRAWAVWNGHTSYEDDDRYELHCWKGEPGAFGSHCNENRHMWTPFSATTSLRQYSPKVSSLGVEFHSFQPLVGGTGGNLVSHECAENEVMIGVLASTYNDQWAPDGSNPPTLGNFGVICAPVVDSSNHYLQYDYATVLTATSWDTAFTYSIDAGPTPARLNRYLSTVFSHGLDVRPYTRQESVVCPAGFAVASLRLQTKYAKIRGISEVRCRHIFDIGLPEPVLNTSGRMGGNEPGTVSTTSSCPPGTVASGARVRAGWFTDAIGLRCRTL